MTADRLVDGINRTLDFDIVVDTDVYPRAGVGRG
jgi:hypothetical protein